MGLACVIAYGFFEMHVDRISYISTRIATLAEIDESVSAIREAGGSQLALLKCISAYPAPPDEMNLRTIPHLSAAFGVPTGLSDHTLGIAVPVAAVALGACIIEKHFTLSRKESGPDSTFSLEPHEFKEMVDAIRTAERALGKVSYEITEKQKEIRIFRRSLFVVKDIKKAKYLQKKMFVQYVRSVVCIRGTLIKTLGDKQRFLSKKGRLWIGI